MKPVSLQPHPEGGHFCEVYRSNATIQNNSGDNRCAMTHIYFSLGPQEVSHFHRVQSDEVWNLYQGDGLHLYLWNASDDAVTTMDLCALNNEFCHVVPAGIWQAAVPMNGKVLVGCTVAPGFEFADFEMLKGDSQTAKRLSALAPEMQDLIAP